MSRTFSLRAASPLGHLFMPKSLTSLLREVRACTLCASSLPHGPRPVLAAHADARILIIGQAPGRRVHATGIPWDDPSGNRLREWLGLERETFYDERRVALIPMGVLLSGDEPFR